MKTNEIIVPRLLLVGSTGAVGKEVLRLALEDPRIGRVVALTRRPLEANAKLENRVTDLEKLPSQGDLGPLDAAICTLGTTLKKAGSAAEFIKIDRDMTVAVAELARKAGATRFALNSSLGANPRGGLYLRTKAEAEEGIRKLAYPVYVIVRPSLIDTRRAELRLGERAGLLAARIVAPLLPKRFKPVTPVSIARALIEGLLASSHGERIIESGQLHD